MKTKFLVIAIASLFILNSCKDNKKTTEGAADGAPVKENFSVELDVAAAKKDDFALYYTEDNTNTFKGEMAAWKGVEGGNKDEKVVFDLSGEIMPTNIRLDFGINKAQDSVKIKNVKISFYGKDITFKGSEFYNWFIEDKQFKTQVDAAQGVLKIEKAGPEYQTPYFYPKQELIDALKKLTQSK